MRIVVGLGNPGKKYDRTRHNVGFRVVDFLAAEMGVTAFRSAFQSLAAEAGMGDGKVVFLKPQTYMNLSGITARAVLDWYKEAPAHLMVILDDFALPVGKLRLRAKGSSGGHNGLESILQHAGTDEVPRLRVGIGPPTPGAAQQAGFARRDHVLDAFTGDEEAKISKAIERASEAVRVWTRDGIETAMNRYNVEEG